MSALRQAVQGYIEMRRGLGFKLRDTERGLIDFAAFLEANDTPHITTELARIRSLRIGRNDWGMSAYSPVIELPLIREPRFPQTVCYPFARSEFGLISIQRRTSSASCPQRLRCRADILAAGSGHGHTIVCSGC
jgi:hypothetical protein